MQNVYSDHHIIVLIAANLLRGSTTFLNNDFVCTFWLDTLYNLVGMHNLIWRFQGIDYENYENSRMHTPPGGIYQAETGNLQQVCALNTV